MNDPAPRTIHSYLNEQPLWHDGTVVHSTPMTGMQWRIWMLTSAGKFFEGMIVFMTGIALPLMHLEFGLSAFEQGIIGAATLAGILIGASTLGGLSDTYGRRTMFIVEMVLFLACIVLLSVAPNYETAVAALFGAGLALGCDYPTGHLMISESIADRARGRMVLGAFAFQAAGAVFGTAIAYLILYEAPGIEAWRYMYAAAIGPALIVILGRLSIPESAYYLASRRRYAQAEHALSKLLHRDPPYPRAVAIHRETEEATQARQGYFSLFTTHRRATLFAAVPWFLQDMATYGLGVFTPVIITASVGAAVDVQSATDVIHNDLLAAKSTAVIDLFFLFGIIAAIALTDRIGRTRLQILGFFGVAVGLTVAAAGSALGQNLPLLYAGFILFQFMTNLGPNSHTYLIAGEVFPTRIRGKGAGFAASFAKMGAILSTLLFPLLIKDAGTSAVLLFLAVMALLGAWVTWQFRIETAGKSLDGDASVA